jgi:hypothetical protein
VLTSPLSIEIEASWAMVKATVNSGLTVFEQLIFRKGEQGIVAVLSPDIVG